MVGEANFPVHLLVSPLLDLFIDVSVTSLINYALSIIIEFMYVAHQIQLTAITEKVKNNMLAVSGIL
jgi:hypothetical protein